MTTEDIVATWRELTDELTPKQVEVAGTSVRTSGGLVPEG
jgi:hypothetical protein